MKQRLAFLYFLRLGATGFGGPIALVGRMRRELVEDRRWLSDEEFGNGLALSQLAPGPLAAQLAMYIGWLWGGMRGAAATSVAFIAPSFLIVIVFAALYRRADGIPWLVAMFSGVGPAVIVIIGRSAVRLWRTTLGSDSVLWLIAAINAVATVITRAESAALVALSGAAIMLLRGGSYRMEAATARSVVAPSFALLSAAGLPAFPLLVTLFLFFATAGLVVFGSGLAIVPFLHGGVVEQHHWLTEAQFMDAVALSFISPGPVVMMVAFIGFMVAGLAGASAAALGVFLPAFALVVIFAPQFARIVRNARLRSFVAGVTAAAIGALMGAVIVLSIRTFRDWRAVPIAAAVLATFIKWPRIPEPAVLAAAAAVGLAFWLNA
ncbi:MAG TPA: chromate efflux transporter [Gemmatimonadaceae bacterium]|nr:chromate efflux transporter [Gemmatimonadaceae bacterium]